MKDLHRLRNLVGCIPVMQDGDATDDNVAIALATYFESLPECPDDDVDSDTGWSRWAVEKVDDLLDRIVSTLEKTP